MSATWHPLFSGKVTQTLSGANTSNGTRIIDFPREQTAGNCHRLPGARLELSAAAGGYDLRYVAQLKTNRSLWGDVWHVTWRFKDAAGNVVLTTPQIDLPDGSNRMHPQFGIYQIDHHQTIGPDIEPHITQVLNSIVAVNESGGC